MAHFAGVTTLDRQHIDRQHIDRQHIDRQHIDRQHIDRQHIDRLTDDGIFVSASNTANTWKVQTPIQQAQRLSTLVSLTSQKLRLLL